MGRETMTGTTETRDEAQMIASILGGNAHEFHNLIRPHERSVYIMALSLLQNEADAEDAAQEAFLKAFRNLAKFRGESKFGTWLVSITLNEARSRLRSKKSLKMESLDETPDEQGNVSPALLRDWREIPSEALERKEVRLLLQQAISDLPPIYREVFLLRDVEELSVSESAEALGISIASVKVRLHRARMMLQKKLAPQLKQVNPKRRWFPWL
jgi:RNA polymerase sigma-70 factor (ECF subfamily)